MGCGLCVKNCPLRIRESIGVQVTGCSSCYTCAECCPTGALRVSGRKVTIDEVLKLSLKDKEFYDQSDGGVTFSGGEALCYAEFIEEVADRLHAAHVSTAIETCGSLKWEQIAGAIDKIDTVLYDIKHMDGYKHKQFTGVDNKLILENASKIAGMKGSHMIVRIPLIGGFNLDEDNIRRTGAFAKSIDISEIHLLPYHSFGEPKYAKINREYTGKDFYSPDDTLQKNLQNILEEMGLMVTIGG
jgi:pyruvate formate lyase activating enzyme